MKKLLLFLFLPSVCFGAGTMRINQGAGGGTVTIEGGGGGSGGGGTGDIEGVTAGTNLTGGGTSGTVTLNLADSITISSLTVNGDVGITTDDPVLDLIDNSGSPGGRLNFWYSSQNTAAFARQSNGWSIYVASNTTNTTPQERLFFSDQGNKKTTLYDGNSNAIVEFDPVGNSSFTTGIVLTTLTGASSLATDSTGKIIAGSGGGGLPLTPGDTNYIQNSNTLQTGSTFYVSSGTVNGTLRIGSSGELYVGSNHSLQSNGTAIFNNERNSAAQVVMRSVAQTAAWVFDADSERVGQNVSLELFNRNPLKLWDSGSNFYTSFESTASATYNQTYVLPATTGTVGQTLSIQNVSSTGTVSLSWQTPNGISGSSSTAGVTIYNSGVAISTTQAYSRNFYYVPFACTITSTTIMQDSGSITYDVKISSSGLFPTTVSMVGAGTKPSVTSGSFSGSAPISWQQTTIPAGSQLEFTVEAATTTRKSTLTLTLVRQ